MPFQKKSNSPLVEERIVVKLIRRSGSWLEQIDKNHDGANLWSEAKITFTGVPYNLKAGRFIDPLTDEERTWFESDESGLGLEKNEMSVLRRKNFWETFTVSLTRNGITLDKSDVMGYLKWAYLRSLPQVAPSWGERFNSAEYKFALVSEDQALKDIVKKSDLTKRAHMFFGKIDASAEKMSIVLDMYNKEHNRSDKIIPNNASREFLIGEIDKLITTDVNGFLEIADDPEYKDKEFIQMAIRRGLIVKKGKSQYSILGDEEPYTFIEMIEYFKSPESNKIKDKISRQLTAIET